MINSVILAVSLRLYTLCKQKQNTSLQGCRYAKCHHEKPDPYATGSLIAARGRLNRISGCLLCNCICMYECINLASLTCLIDLCPAGEAETLAFVAQCRGVQPCTPLLQRHQHWRNIMKMSQQRSITIIQHCKLLQVSSRSA